MLSESELISQIELYDKTAQWICAEMLSLIKKLDILDKKKGSNYSKNRRNLENKLKVLIGKVESESKGWERIDREIKELEDVDY